MRQIILILSISFILSGCAGAIVAGAAASGGYAFYKRDSLQAFQDDHNIKKHITHVIKNDRSFNGSRVIVTAFRKIVLLVGQTPQASLRAKAEKIAQSTPGVERIYNEITINSPTSPLTRTSDSWITTKVKSEMLATKELRAGDIKVLTENGTVYLIGKVDREDADIAVDVARRATGVQKVVKAFVYY